MRLIQRVILIISSIIISLESAEAVNIELVWDAPTTRIDGTPITNLSGYNVYYSDTSREHNNLYKIKEDAKSLTKYTIQNLELGKAYYFAVTAYDANGIESMYSDEVKVEIPSGGLPPTGGADGDGDGISDVDDNCASVFNPDQSDIDQDGIGDLCDREPVVPNRDAARYDFDGDGISDALLQLKSQKGSPLSFRIVQSSDSQSKDLTFGNAGDKVLPGDYNGDGVYDIAVARKVKGAYQIDVLDSLNNQVTSIKFDNVKGTILSGCDFDGDAANDLAYYDKGKISYRSSLTNSVVSIKIKSLTAKQSISCGDIDGDGQDDILFLTERSKAKGIKTKAISNKAKRGSHIFLAYSRSGLLFSKEVSNPRGIFIGDVNADGLSDPAFITKNGSGLAINFLPGLGTESINVNFPTYRAILSGKLPAQDGTIHDAIIAQSKNSSLMQMNLQDFVIDRFGPQSSGSSLVGDPIGAPAKSN